MWWWCLSTPCRPPPWWLLLPIAHPLVTPLLVDLSSSSYGASPMPDDPPDPQTQTPFWPRCRPLRLWLWEATALGRWHPHPATSAHPAPCHPSKICTRKNHPNLCPWPWCRLKKKQGKVNCTWLLSQYCFVVHFSLIARVCCECRKSTTKLKVVVMVRAYFSMPDGLAKQYFRRERLQPWFC
jgi:hypothetical protein